MRQALGKPEGALTPEDMASLTRLEAHDLNIESLAGLEHATALTVLDLDRNAALADVSPLASLTNLSTLKLSGTSITDAGLASLTSLLTKLKLLTLSGTSIGDAGAASLSSLTNLEDLSLSLTNITDVSPLLSLTKLKAVFLHGTPLSDESINEHIPALKAKGVTVGR